MVRESPFKGKTGLQRVWRAFHYSLDGFREAYKCEDAFRQESLLAAILIPLSFFLPVGGIGRALMIASAESNAPTNQMRQSVPEMSATLT